MAILCGASSALVASTLWALSGRTAPSGEPSEAHSRRLGTDLDRCSDVVDVFPIKGVQYVPHVVGEPYPHPAHKADNIYSMEFSLLYQRDMPLIRQLGADTLRLRPWRGTSDDRRNMYSTMARHGLCKVVPTFQMTQHYINMIQEGMEQPDTSTSSALHKDFQHFAARLYEQHLEGLKIAAWTVDMSIDLEELMPLVTKCSVVPPPTSAAGQNFNRFVALLTALVNWVQGVRVVQALLR